ncbi:MAG: RnfABCDGE type electron transport complex subunit D [Acidobacteriota bacterium]|nr:RnfABCDGE type electron transport complex subunit D [Acidobacteriota bacterium]
MSTPTALRRLVASLPRPPRDPRLYQICVLSSILLWGAVALDLALQPSLMLVLAAAALGTQYVAGRWVGLERFDPRSPLISTLSLCLLLRTQSPLLAASAAVIAIGSKFLIRRRGKHVFNPTNLALVVLLLTTDGVWFSPGRWGSAAFFAFFLAGFGMLVVYRAARSDVTWAFLAAWSAVLVGRALWLGDPLTIPLHQLQSGALLIFAFFMISDPKTTPDSRLGRVVFAALVAAVGGWLQLGLFIPEGLLYALAASAPLVPVLDRLFPGERYAWSTPKSEFQSSQPQSPRPQASRPAVVPSSHPVPVSPEPAPAAFAHLWPERSSS